MRAIKVYCPPGVEPPLYAFIDALDGKLKAKLLWQIFRLRNLPACELKEPHFKHFSLERYSQMYELREKGKVLIRIVFTVQNEDVILLTSFIKRQPRDTKKALDQSLYILLHLHSAMRCAMKDIPIWHRMSFSSAAMKNRMMRFWVQQSSTTMLWKSTTVSSLPFSTKRSMAMSFYSRLMPKLPRRISGRKLIEGNCKKLQQLPIFL